MRRRGRERVRAIESAGGQAIFQPADALNRDSLRRARDATIKQWGTVSVLVNGAGGNKPEGTLPPGGDFCKLSLTGWQEVFDLNLVGGALLPCQVFGETMVAARKGSVINIASMASILPLSRVVAYSASKAAVLNLTKFLARMGDQGGAGERHQSRLLPRRAEPGHAPQAGWQFYGTRRADRRPHPDGPLRRGPGTGRRRRLAGGARASSFVTGQNIVVDGGFSSVTI